MSAHATSARSSLTRHHAVAEHRVGCLFRIALRRESGCCCAPLLLVRSMAGGFVRSNCSKCDRADTLGLSEFLDLNLWAPCPECSERMVAGFVPGVGRASNYGFSCGSCNVYIWLADLLPYWDKVGTRTSA